MAQLLYLGLVALAIVGTHAVGFTGYGSYPFLGGNPLYGTTPILTGLPLNPPKPLSLTCSMYGGKSSANAIAVTIKERQSAYGGLHPSLLSFSGGFGGLDGKGSLQATVDIYSATGGQVSIAFTERARPERGCVAEDFGSFIAPKSDHFGGGFGVGDLYGGYGGLGGYGGYGGLGGYGGYGGALGFAGGIGGFLPTAGVHGGGYGNGPAQIPGVIANLNLAPGTSSTINIDNLAGFDSLKQLAGRGIIVCPDEAIDTTHYGAQCDGYILACCALHYDDGDLRLSPGGPGVPGGHGGPGPYPPPPPPPPPQGYPPNVPAY